MKTKKVVETNTENIRFGWYDEKEDKFYEITSVEVDGKITHNQLINAVANLAEQIRLSVHEDLCDVWKRMDKIEKELGR